MRFGFEASTLAAAATFAAAAHTYTGEAFAILQTRPARPTLADRRAAAGFVAAPRAPGVAFGRRA